MKYSRQREAIYQAVRESCSHPSADAVYEQVRLQHPQISLGTVYRNLGQLTESGLLTKIAMPSGCDRFDGRLDEHYHMICTRCSAVVDVELSSLASLSREVLDKTGFQVSDCHLVLEGLCRDCAALGLPTQPNS